eukprot:TRINITY_DN32429_c0_g2_i1.p1 TRINITY_DN32429_c0_g2~~TRINITY_DN32429_c0_g2_i1.p1  ORF type:complete len:502 (+),score=61.93 TRINITY_DN32429_c0_g2_i1:114-1619(+)
MQPLEIQGPARALVNPERSRFERRSACQRIAVKCGISFLWAFAIVTALQILVEWWRQFVSIQGCSDLTNHGSFMTVNVLIGTPAQRLNLIVDTGSNSVVVPSCECVERGHCGGVEECFNFAQSSTFLVSEPKVRWKLTYGSGPLEALATTDIVNVDSVKAQMINGLLLVTDLQEMQVSIFGGILGLGNPENAGRQRPFWTTDDESPSAKLFTNVAGVKRFSVCSRGQDFGALRFGIPAVGHALPSVGSLHWSLNLEGVSVGSTMSLCAPGQSDQPCQAIIDSGTTLIMGPRVQVLQLLGSLCVAWPRCRAASGGAEEPAEVFVRLYLSCEDWDTFEELPSTFFHLVGAGGEKESVELSGRALTLSMQAGKEDTVLRSIFGSIPDSLRSVTSGRQIVCVPAIGNVNFRADNGGHAWIMGLPMFFQRAVGFDTSDPPSISFGSPPCDACHWTPSSVVGEGNTPLSQQPLLLQISRFDGEVRVLHVPLADTAFDSGASPEGNLK